MYEFYVQEIAPAQKSRQHALTIISKYLKTHSAEDLKAAIRNYKPTATRREKKYRHDPANFFGTREKVFEDYLPENFQPPKPNSDGQPENLFEAGWY